MGLLALEIQPKLEGHLAIEAPLAVVVIFFGIVAARGGLLAEEQPDGGARALSRTRLLRLCRRFPAPGRLGRRFSDIRSFGRTLERVRGALRGRRVSLALLQRWRLLKQF